MINNKRIIAKFAWELSLQIMPIIRIRVPNYFIKQKLNLGTNQLNRSVLVSNRTWNLGDQGLGSILPKELFTKPTVILGV